MADKRPYLIKLDGEQQICVIAQTKAQATAEYLRDRLDVQVASAVDMVAAMRDGIKVVELEQTPDPVPGD